MTPNAVLIGLMKILSPGPPEENVLQAWPFFRMVNKIQCIHPVNSFIYP